MEPFYEQRRWLFLFGKDARIEWRPSHRLFRKIVRSKEEQPNLCSPNLQVITLLQKGSVLEPPIAIALIRQHRATRLGLD